MSSTDRQSCAVLVEGALGQGVLIPDTAYRVAQINEHWEPSPEIGSAPHVTTVIRFDPVEARADADASRDRLREALEAVTHANHAPTRANGPMPRVDCLCAVHEEARRALAATPPARAPEPRSEYLSRREQGRLACTCGCAFTVHNEYGCKPHGFHEFRRTYARVLAAEPDNALR